VPLFFFDKGNILISRDTNGTTDAHSKKRKRKLINKEPSEVILRKCHGLPLAINAMSGLLALHRELKEEWARVRCSVGFSQDNR
jgi:hypothetical protein